VTGGALAGKPAIDLGTRDTFADLGATVAFLFGAEGGNGLAGESFAPTLGLG
jgi:phosphopentomutase